MESKFSTEYGEITVSSKVVSEMASNVASSCYGVVGMGSRNKKDGIVNLLRPDNMNKGVDVRSSEDGMVIDLHIIVQYGINIATVCESVVSRVKYSVEAFVGVTVKKVSVKVEGIRVSE